MGSIIEFIMKNETVIMASLFAVIIILLIFVLITDAINRKKEINYKNNLFINNSSDMTDAYSDALDNEENDYTIDIPVQNSTTVSEIKYVEDDEELEKTKAQIELKNLKEELIKADLKEKEEKLKKLEEKQEKENIKPVEVNNELHELTEFEKKQEEQAIISLEQFNMLKDKIDELPDEVEYKDEGNEPISLKELEELYNTKEIKTSEILEKIELEKEIESKEPIVKPTPAYNDEIKFKSSPVISPVYGFDTEERISQIEVENTMNLDKLSEEIRKTNEFLSELKELRKNLE